MDFSLHTDSYDEKFPLEHEVKQMQQFLYADIPASEREQYCELEKIWTTRRELAPVDDEDTAAAAAAAPAHLIPLKKEYVTTGYTDTHLPIGINSRIAVSLSNMEEAKKHLMSAELEQYHIFWKSYLRRCRFRVQYNEKLKMLTANPDANLRRVTEMILRDEDLIKYRDSLPEVILDEGGLNNDYAEREDGAITSETYIPEATAAVEATTGPIYAFYYQRYRAPKNREWKCSSHVFSSIAPPTGSICEDYLIYAFYSSDTVITVRLCKIEQKKPVEEWTVVTVHSDTARILHCAVNCSGWMAVSNGTFVFQKCLGRPIIYKHTIQGQIVSTIHIDDSGFLQIGTTNGQIYDVSPFKLRSYTKDRELLAIVNISTSGGRKICAQTINGIFSSKLSESLEGKQLIIMRPLTSIIKGALIFFLTKYGTLKIRSIIHDGVDINLPVLKGMHANIDHLTPWYNRGIYFDGKTCAVLYPNGAVLVRQI